MFESLTSPTPDPPIARKKSSWAPVVVVVAVIAIGLGVVGTSTSGGAGMYNYTLAQLAENKADIGRREIKVSGKVRKGSVRGEPGSREFRFDIEDGQGHTLTVAYPRLLPDPFEEGREAIVQGRLEAGELAASSLTVKCPSRYADAQTMSEADQQKYYQQQYQKHKAAQPGAEAPK